MTPEQIEIAKALRTIKFIPGSFDGWFVRNMASKATILPGIEITEGQNEWLYRILYKYRNQVPLIYNKYKGNQNCSKK